MVVERRRLRRLTPSRPCSAISRATRRRLIRMPLARPARRGRAGRRRCRREAAWIAATAGARATSAAARADGRDGARRRSRCGRRAACGTAGRPSGVLLRLDQPAGHLEPPLIVSWAKKAAAFRRISRSSRSSWFSRRRRPARPARRWSGPRPRRRRSPPGRPSCAASAPAAQVAGDLGDRLGPRRDQPHRLGAELRRIGRPGSSHRGLLPGARAPKSSGVHETEATPEERTTTD